ncbi:MAG: prefoldin subunit beta [Methanomassiliicoccus sp.]|nr:prefoldin subunit beta [Methanomassiliicoccus sp.]
MDELSPKVQNQIAQFQQLQQQLQSVLNQKFQMDAQVKEMQRTTEELNRSPEDVVIYKSVGSLLIKAEGKEAVLKEIEDDKETMEIRVKSLERQEKSLKDRYQTLQEQINKALSSGAAGGPISPM